MQEERLLHLLKKKKDFFEAILDLSEEEGELSISDWIDVLEQKKILLACIEEIDAELMPFKQTLHMLSQDVTDELDSIRLVIKRILHLDSLNQEKRKKSLSHHKPPIS